MNAVAPLRTKLPRVLADTARLRTALIAQLGGLSMRGERASVRGEDQPQRGGWLACPGAGGTLLLRLQTGDALGAAACLAEREGALAAIESALGVELIPVAVVETPAPDAAVVRLELADGPLWIAAAPGYAAAFPGRQPAIESWAASIAVAIRVGIAGPTLPLANLQALAPGDLLLLPAGAASVAECADRAFAARLLPPPARLRLEARAPSHEIPMNQPPNGATPDGDALDPPIALEILLDPVTIAYSQAAALAPGSVIDLKAEGASLAVAIRTGGRTIATGELVALGAGYGVVIRTRVG